MPDQNDNQTDIGKKYRLPKSAVPRILLENIDRPRGIFTKVDREFIIGDKSYEYKQSESNRRQKIRERVTNGIVDFQLLNWISDREQEKLFDDIPTDQLHDYLVSLIAFVYRGIGQNCEMIEEVVQKAIFQVETENEPRSEYRGGIADVSVSIEIEQGYDVNKIYERFQQDQSSQLTPAEVGVLVRAGILDENEIEQLVFKHK